MSLVHPVVLCGGAGSRLWPSSTPDRPKPLLSLGGEASLLQGTLQRVCGDRFADPRVVCGVRHADAVAQQVSTPQIVEPMPRGTAAAILAATVALRDRRALVLVLPADHVVARPEALADAVRTAIPAAQRGALITFGIHPDRPETGYGWIRVGEPVEPGIHRVDRFLEKPDHRTARALLAAGGHLWNSGMFLFRASALIEEIARLAPELLEAVQHAVQHATIEPGRISLQPAAFARAPAGSLDVVVMERTTAAAVVPVALGWDDVGTWEAVWRLGAPDPQGNVVHGRVQAESIQGCYLDAEGIDLVACGLEQLVVVARPDGVLVCGRSESQRVGPLACRIAPKPGGTEAIWHAREHTLRAGERLRLGRATATVVRGEIDAGGRRCRPGDGITGEVVAVTDSVLVEIIPRGAG
ncbi:MAG TPA: mannose-1-phosphate guanyltransferase [Deltaproteobacteria bacterium]|nr:mannose-1-phosphate guanyltransferase [Deltaproteobacteria bacterium]